MAKRVKKVAQTEKARTIIKRTRSSIDGFLSTCDDKRTARRASGGQTTDAEQDCLRAMVVFAAAGLDSTLKRLIRDCLRDLAAIDDNVAKGFETFVARQIRGDDPDAEVQVGHKFLATILVAPVPQERLIETYVRDLTGSSLQSSDEIFRTSNALGVEPAAIGLDGSALRKVFIVRNRIIHELDIDLEGAQRKRRPRKREDMIEFAELLCSTADAIVGAVESKIRSCEPEKDA